MFLSCTTGVGIKELKQKLCELALKQKVLTNLIPESYIVMDKLLFKTKSEDRSVLVWTEYRSLAKKCNVTEESSLITMTEFFHDVGSLIWFNEVCDFIFLYIFIIKLFAVILHWCH